jgi:hypothetical protein
MKSGKGIEKARFDAGQGGLDGEEMSCCSESTTDEEMAAMERGMFRRKRVVTQLTVQQGE